MQAKGKEDEIQQVLSEKVMTDEETDDEEQHVLVKRALPWRSEKLMKALDNHKDTRCEAAPKEG